MIQNRKDMTTWVMHFIHDRNPENDPAENINEGEATPLFPFHEDPDVNSRFELWEMADAAYPIEPDASAFAVLLKIISDGHIRAGWAFRGDRPTIYGTSRLLFHRDAALRPFGICEPTRPQHGGPLCNRSP
jgi:hypothetical protein